MLKLLLINIICIRLCWSFIFILSFQINLFFVSISFGGTKNGISFVLSIVPILVNSISSFFVNSFSYSVLVMFSLYFLYISCFLTFLLFYQYQILMVLMILFYLCVHLCASCICGCFCIASL